MTNVRKAHWYENIWTKMTAGVILCALGVVVLSGISQIIKMEEYGILSNVSYEKSNVMQTTSDSYAYLILMDYKDDGVVTEYNKGVNFHYEVLDKSGNILAQNAKLDDAVEIGKTFTYDSVYELYYSWDNHSPNFRELINSMFPYAMEQYADAALPKEDVNITIQVAKILTEHDNYLYGYSEYQRLSEEKVPTMVTTLAGILGMIYLLVWLMAAAGHDVNEEGIALTWFDKIPLDIFSVITLGYLYCAGVVLYNLFRDLPIPFDTSIITIAFVAVLIMFCLGILMWMLSFAKRIKAGIAWKNTLIYMIWKVVWEFISNLHLVIKVAVVGVAYLIAFVAFNDAWEAPFALSAVMIIIILWICIKAQKVKELGQRIRNGELDARINTEIMPKSLKDHVYDLYFIGDGMKAAVEDQLKAERFKTELITNVSHDIKTPITSIVNYVDLLQKEHTEEDEVKYLEVLERQSQRLKKLTEDLVDASKASTGNMTVEKTRINVNEIIQQSVAEYAEKFEERHLEPVVNVEDENMFIYADGSLFWRILSNLYSNASKYAMENTRVYIDAFHKEKNQLMITVKNISAERLNISSDELMERFVRGDQSRHTEGSGLGLNIARSLAELQGGSLNLVIDGDLFKAELLFPCE